MHKQHEPLPRDAWSYENATPCPSTEIHYPPHRWGEGTYCLGRTPMDQGFEAEAQFCGYSAEVIEQGRRHGATVDRVLHGHWLALRTELDPRAAEVYDSLISQRISEPWNPESLSPEYHVLDRCAADARACLAEL